MAFGLQAALQFSMGIPSPGRHARCEKRASVRRKRQAPVLTACLRTCRRSGARADRYRIEALPVSRIWKVSTTPRKAQGGYR
jgi:hypothetical protein